MNPCIFCKIVAGQIKSDLVLENQKVLAFRDIGPQAPVHILIIPKKHVQSISTLEAGDASLLLDIHQAMLKLVQSEGLEKDGFRLVTNDGKNGGQSVDHLHFHLLGGRQMAWPPG